MGVMDKILKKQTQDKKREPKPTLAGDIPLAAAWLRQNMTASGCWLDGTIESFRELDRFYDDQHRPGGLLDGKVGDKLFAVGSYMGEVFRTELGGVWETDDDDPLGEVNIAVRLPSGTVCWPVQRAGKRFQNGPEDGLYAYGLVTRDGEKGGGA